MKESVQDRPAAVCGADRPTARESAFPAITLKIFGKRERKNHMNWNIITDSSCDLLPSTSPDGRIRLTSVPFTIRIGERDFVDDEHLDTMEMLSAMEQEHSAGHTSCPTPDAWLAQFEQADCAIAITISSQLSGSMNSALAARDMALEKNPDKKIVILDSLSTGPEVLLCVKEIERLIRQGLSFDDIAAHARGFLQKTKILFALSSFDNLIKNGRIHRLTGMLAKALGIWGIGSGSDEGKITFESKARGAKKVVQTLVSTMKEHGFIGGNVAISHCDNLALAQTLKNSILDIWENTSIEILPTRGLCSYYAERGGLIVSY